MDPILQTGGSARGATRIKSEAAAEAARMPSASGMMPRLDPSLAMTRTDGCLISRLIRGRSTFSFGAVRRSAGRDLRIEKHARDDAACGDDRAQSRLKRRREKDILLRTKNTKHMYVCSSQTSRLQPCSCTVRQSRRYTVGESEEAGPLRPPVIPIGGMGSRSRTPLGSDPGHGARPSLGSSPQGELQAEVHKLAHAVAAGGDD